MNAMVENNIPILDTVIIGAGFAGLGAAIRLRQSGVNNIAVLERADEVGGTWRDNQYPGAACDIPSNLYSYSFVKNPNWQSSYSGSRDILAYVHQMVEQFNLQPLLKFGRNVTDIAYDEAQAIWQVNTENESYQARSVIMAQGPLSNASLPSIEGIDSFKGEKIHSARWNHNYDFSGKRVAVVGTGASGVQIIPELVKTAAKVKVFQRTPGWVIPRVNFQRSEWNKALFRRFPKTQAAVRELLFWGHETAAAGVIWDTPATRLVEQVAKSYIKRAIKDPWMRRQVTPDFRIGCKRVLMSSDYYPALQKDNCELLTWPIAKISEKGIRTAEGLEHEVDCIVFATGFDVSKAGTPFPVTGRHGRKLNQEWQRGAQAFKSVSVSGYPNLFMTFGPNSGPGHNSALVYMEAQIDYIAAAIQKIAAGKIRSMDVKPLVQTSYNLKLQKRLAKTNWNSGCKSWYLTEDGFNSTMYPGFATQYRRQMKLRMRDYTVKKHAKQAEKLPSAAA